MLFSTDLEKFLPEFFLPRSALALTVTKSGLEPFFSSPGAELSLLKEFLELARTISF